MNPVHILARAFVAVGDWLTGLHSTANDRINAATADLRCPWCHLDTCYGEACRGVQYTCVYCASSDHHGEECPTKRERP